MGVLHALAASTGSASSRPKRMPARRSVADNDGIPCTMRSVRATCNFDKIGIPYHKTLERALGGVPIHKGKGSCDSALGAAVQADPRIAP
jgi:hypothetical protein